MKKEEEFKEIKSELLIEIIQHDSNTDYFKSYHTYFSELENKSTRWDYNAYIRKAKALINDNGLDNFFDFKLNTKPEIIDENGYEYFVKYKILIKNLKIACNSEQIKLHSLVIDEKYPEDSNLMKDQYRGGIYIEFKNCEFVSIKSNYNSYVNIDLGQNARLTLTKNKFHNVDFYLNANYNNCFVHFDSNKFYNRHLTISGAVNNDGTHGFRSNSWSISGELAGKLYAVKRLERMVNKNGYDKKHSELIAKLEKKENISNNEILDYLIASDNKYRINYSDIEYSQSKNTIVSFRNNEINKIQIGGQKLFFLGKNEINKICTSHLSENIYYGPYNRLDKEKQYGIHHKELFIALKEDAIRRNDKSQELIFNREVLKCERQLLKKESANFKWYWDKTRKDRIILTFNRLTNNYGLSWIVPIFWILGLNLLYCFFFFGFNYRLSLSWENFFNTLGMFSEFLLPTNNVEDITGIKNLNKGWEAANIIKNIFLAAFIYQTLRAFRRFRNT
ncbi:hypothetical protein [Pseudotenacibaculum haliotis]|uniref:Uncharacterized protein n=1 Tax=Pseudotenacibaculum haliotis TaxID=1862138 RepID=A0ABW5LRE2_9FLAO